MDLEFTRGDNFRFKFRLRNKAGNEITPNGVNFQIYLTVKKNTRDKDIKIQKTLTSGIVYNEEDKYYHVEFTPEDTSDLEYGSYVYDIELKTADTTKTLIMGNITLTEEVTFRRDE